MTNRFAAGLSKIKHESGRTPVSTEPPAESAAEVARPTASAVAPSRQGKVSIAGYFDPAVRQQLAIMAIKQNKSQAALLAEALNMLFERDGEPPIARA